MPNVSVEVLAMVDRVLDLLKEGKYAEATDIAARAGFSVSGGEASPEVIRLMERRFRELRASIEDRRPR